MLAFILIIVAVISVIAYFWYQNKQASLREEARLSDVTTRFKQSKYRCAVIQTGSYACQAAKDLADRPLLLDSAPVLPLPACDISQCECQYKRRNDRRDDDRRSPYASSLIGNISNVEDKRQKKDRRKTAD